MRIMPSVLSLFAGRMNSSLSSAARTRCRHGGDARRHHQPAVYPIGQSYTWGGPTTASNGFAPAIGYDAYLGGNGY